jgi:hypothetical protein
LHRHTPLTPVSLRSYVVLPVLLEVAEIAERQRPKLGDDLTFFLRPPSGRPPTLVPPGARVALVHPARGAVETTGFPLRLQLRTEIGDGPRLFDVGKLPKKFATSRRRRDTHVLVDLAVRRPTVIMDQPSP